MEDLLKLLSVQTKSRKCDQMYEHLLAVARSKGWEVQRDQEWNIYIQKGLSETFPCVVAHMDTVHAIEKGGITPIVINGNIIGFNPETMQTTGIGGDDKCGIWAALHCLDALPACKAVFFVDEEIGCKGSNYCDLSFFNDCRFILQADRRGNDDFVTDIQGELSSDDFLGSIAPIITKYKYHVSYGAMTDVMALRDRKVGISVANMSAGYYRPHTDEEYINIADLANVCAMMLEICETVTDVSPFTYEPKKWEPSGRSFTPWWDKDGKMHSSGEGFSYDPTIDPLPKFSNGRGLRSDAVRCSYCAEWTNPDDLYYHSPATCMDCEIKKDATGMYPVAQQSELWRKLQNPRPDEVKRGTKNGRKKNRKIKWLFRSKKSQHQQPVNDGDPIQYEPID